MIADVFFEIACLIFTGLMQSVSGSISTKTGMPPFSTMQCAVETKLREGKITSLFFISNSDNAKFNAEVPLFTATQLFDCVYFLNSFYK